MRRLAVLGGDPAYPDGLRFAHPTVPALDDVTRILRPSYDDAQLTNGRLVRALEERAADYLGVRRVVAVGSCTSGLILSLRALGAAGSVVMPSFTFSATAHAAWWCRAEPVFTECDPWSYQLDVDDARQRLRDDTSVVMATHVFGAPCDVEGTLEMAGAAGLPVVFDAAHGLGGFRRGTPLGGFGAAEVFSLSPTKLVVAGEGGLVATNDDALADDVALGREYGDPGDYNTVFPGLNARMSELHAAVALASFDLLDDALADRRRLAAAYCRELAVVDGVEPQVIDDGDLSTYKDFTITVDEDRLGIGRDRLAEVLRADGIDTRPYFSPPVHLQDSHRRAGVVLPVTELAASRCLSLPLYPRLGEDDVERVADVVCRAQAFAAELAD